MNLELKSQEITEKLKAIDRTASLQGTLRFPEHPSHKKDMAVAQLVYADRPIGAIYLFWRSEKGKIHHRKLATAILSQYRLLISRIVVAEGGDVSIIYSAHSLRGSTSVTKRLCGRLSENGERWKGEITKRALRFVD